MQVICRIRVKIFVCVASFTHSASPRRKIKFQHVFARISVEIWKVRLRIPFTCTCLRCKSSDHFRRIISKKKLDILFRFINFIHTSPPGLVKYSISHMHGEELVQSSDLSLKVWGFENVFCTGAASNNFVGYFLALLFSHLKHTTSKQKEESITFNSSHIWNVHFPCRYLNLVIDISRSEKFFGLHSRQCSAWSSWLHTVI